MSFPICLFSVVAGVFGAMVGSFLNVLIYRLPRESLTVTRPMRSFCPACGKSIPWYDNIPVVSFVRLRGRCRFCGGLLSWRYPLVEALTSILFVCLTIGHAPDIINSGSERLQLLGIYIIQMYMLATVLVVTFIDLDFKIIPDEITYSGIVAAPLACALLPGLQENSSLFIEALNAHLAGLISSLGGALVGGGTLLAVGWIGKAALKKEALGMGDVKFMAFVGGMFGWEGVLMVFVAGCAAGSIVGVPYRLITGKHEVPFGPFLSLGVVTVIFFRAEIIELLEEWPRFASSLWR